MQHSGDLIYILLNMLRNLDLKMNITRVCFQLHVWMNNRNESYVNRVTLSLLSHVMEILFALLALSGTKGWGASYLIYRNADIIRHCYVCYDGVGPVWIGQCSSGVTKPISSVELLSQFPPFPSFLPLTKHTLAMKSHVYIWQVSYQGKKILSTVSYKYVYRSSLYEIISSLVRIMFRNNNLP